jgi:DNA-binding transcriptional MerR regulator
MRIGDLAKASNMTTTQIRVYEKIGIIRPSSLTPGGHHLYAPQTVALLQKVNRLKETERRTLAEIRDILNPKVV